ncbi:helix-turn-helix domain protein [Marinomonas posidonica IVIA-Po-181]|uniref:Helix-turn-helix domain protein n=1 Tax=Marinomonas posidonica (strain CECT 7376 / NCIMB 14433 / IVIA-Po-181) TaxID=491952 RepID=F6D0N6_MARPP|nr:helix-turn-helix domain protein [Marinomonas posidonica IVIA-Po-181]
MSRLSEKNISANLKVLCSYSDSISSCCRKMGINRQQFTKYLNGTSAPSVKNLRKMCAFFGVETEEITMATAAFKKLVSSRRRVKKPKSILDNSPQGERHTKLLESMMLKSSEDIQPYLGDYYYYYFTPSYEGHISKGFARISLVDGIAYSHFYERAEPGQAMLEGYEIGKFVGVVFVLGERIQIVDYGVHCQRAISQTILYGATKGSFSLLSGITLGVQGRNSRIPFSSRIVFEKIASNISLKRKLKNVGLFEVDAADISSVIRSRLETSSSIGHPHIFSALEN